MATVIAPNGLESIVHPNDGKAFTFEEVCAHIGCNCVEPIMLPDGSCMWLDEAGKRRNLPVNNKATLLALSAIAGKPDDCVVGCVLVVNQAERFSDDDCEIAPYR